MHDGHLDFGKNRLIKNFQSKQDEPKPHPARETELLNELVREYLKYSGYRHTLSVFSAGE